MPRFGMKSLLIVFAAVALWFSTFAGYTGGDDVRAFIMLAILITSGVAALSSTARRRAFWAGFFGTMLAVATKLFFIAFVATFRWMREFSMEWAVGIKEPMERGEFAKSINATIFLSLTLLMATVIGLLCVHVYDACKKQTSDVDQNRRD
jgi:hypothetical protein